MTSTPMNVLIAGAGVAGLEAAFALRALAGDRVEARILAPTDEFVYRPMSVGEPFTAGRARRYPLADLAAAAGAGVTAGAMAEVDAPHRRARTGTGEGLAYDALLVCPGAVMRHPFEHTTRFEDQRVDELLHGLVQDVEGGYVRRLAIVVPAPMPWPLPAYELALLASERAWDMREDMTVVVVTPETSPLAVFGAHASHEVARLLTDRRIEVVTSAYAEVPAPGTIVVHPGGRKIGADRIVSLPALVGPAIPGLPQDGNGFVPIDELGRVRGVEGVWAAGDATDYPLKHGSVAAQLADTIAADIARRAGAEVSVEPFSPTLEGVLLTGARPRRLRHSPGDAGELHPAASGQAPEKIVARHLMPHLAEPQPAGDRA